MSLPPTEPTILFALMVKTDRGIEVLCPECREIIFTASTERAAGWSHFKIQTHAAICAGSLEVTNAPTTKN